MKNISIDKLIASGMIKKAKDVKIEVSKKKTEGKSLKEIYPDGEFIETPYKQVFKLKYKFKKNEIIGNINMGNIFFYKNNFNKLFNILGKNENLKNFKFDKLLFFDVESTGLSTGAGNMVFLIGLGYFKEEIFIIKQYFIEDYINEKGLLFLLEKEFKKRPHLISFNGKTFDFYVLKNRFILSRKFEFTLDNLLHYDLLHSSRRIWKNIFDDFSLGNLEKKILREERTNDDIPGYLIPMFYKEYLKTGDTNKIKNIIYHNLIDVKSMLGLLIVQLNIISNILNDTFTDNVNYFSISKLFRNSDYQKHKKLLFYNLKNKYDLYNTFKEIIKIYKKEEQFDKLENILGQMIIEYENDLFPYIEYAKFYEHIKKEYKKALDIIYEVENSKFYHKLTDIEIDDIIKRKERLNKKCLKN